MKARVIATGKIVEVSQGIYSPYQYVDNNGTIYTEEEIEILQEVLDSTIDYWTSLEHQYAGMAMQGMLANANHYLWERKQNYKSLVANAAELAHSLVEKMKEERK